MTQFEEPPAFRSIGPTIQWFCENWLANWNFQPLLFICALENWIGVPKCEYLKYDQLTAYKTCLCVSNAMTKVKMEQHTFVGLYWNCFALQLRDHSWNVNDFRIYVCLGVFHCEQLLPFLSQKFLRGCCRHQAVWQLNCILVAEKQRDASEPF